MTELMTEEITEDIFKTHNYKMATKTNTPFGQLIITNLGLNPVTLDRDVANFLGIAGADIGGRCRGCAPPRR